VETSGQGGWDDDWNFPQALDDEVTEAFDSPLAPFKDTGSPDNQYRLALRDSKPPLSVGTSFGDPTCWSISSTSRRRRDDPDAWVLVILGHLPLRLGRIARLVLVQPARVAQQHRSH
jgi:hypothetical protein